MVSALIRELLTGDSKEIRDLVKNEAALIGFLTLVKGVDDLPGVASRFYERPRSMYQVTAPGYSMEELTGIMADYFGPPAKASGKNLRVSMRFEPTVKFIGGIRKDQALFLKKMKTGSFYGALWPWERETDKVEILLGYCSSNMSKEDYSQLDALVKKFLSQKKMEAVPGIGGQIHGISLPSFLQMSEMEEATYTLKVSSQRRSGLLYIKGGELIAAQYGDVTGNEAAYRIISWDNAAIQIEAADPERVREIHEPLMHVMMESLKIKDEEGASIPPPARVSPATSSSPPPAIDQESSETLRQEINDFSVDALAMESRAPSAQAPMEPQSAVTLPEPEIAEPVGLPVDQSMEKQKQMSRQTKLLIALAAVIVLAIAVAVGGKLMKIREARLRYETLEERIAASEALDEQIVLMMRYIKAHPEDSHRAELERRLADVNVEIEKQDYERTLADVSRLPIDDKFEKKALSLYTAFLTKYPESTYKKQIDESIQGIGLLLGTAYFESLKKLAATDFLSRYAAYQSYLEQFPQGEERQVVERMVQDLAKEYLGTIEKKISNCDLSKKWEPCIEYCDRFLAAFSNGDLSNGDLMDKIKGLRAQLQDKKDLAELTEKVILAGDDLVRARGIYSDYLARRPDTTQREAIGQRIDRLNADLAQNQRWKETKAYASDPAKDIVLRVRRLDEYIRNHGGGPYALSATNLRDRLESELQDAIRTQREEAARRNELAQQQAEREHRERENQRILSLQKQVSKQIKPLSSRFVDNGDGTVTDRLTGLTWCILDSYLVLGRCIPYDVANTYVQSLNTGGHADWSLPTAGELATIYKNRPFFPGSGAKWYWTSDSFARGFHQVVDVVTSVPETVFTRMSQSVESCGSVRAVRR